ncbi:hypothetical protein [Metaplanococcus flavidus]|uniref:Uncharacterized protein n=1 Tax=Metaplanococcus flavidus TaxID=569883 RepID=A0ABW3LCV8_9BACL
MTEYQTNFEIACESLSSAREDHYDGIHSIYRLSAWVVVPDSMSFEESVKQFDQLVKDLSNLKVRPNRIYKHGGGLLEVDYYPRGYQMVMNKGQYAGLQLEFAQFLDQSPILGMSIQEGCYYDDPDDSVKSVSNAQINFFPEFNSKCFGTLENEKINIYNIR